MNPHTTQFEEYLQGIGLRLTRERRLVLQAAFARHDHFDAEDLVADLRRQGCSVSRATVYRALALLVQSRLLRKVLTGERRARFEHVLGHRHHEHFRCVACGKVIEFTDPALERILADICKRRRFEPVRHRVQIAGYCSACRRQMARAARSTRNRVHAADPRPLGKVPVLA